MTWTHAVILITAVSLIAWDVIAHFVHQPQESRVLLELSAQWTVIPYVMGILCGHWFGGRQAVPFSGWGYAMIPAIVIFTIDLAWLRWGAGQPIWRWGPWYVLAGIPAGCLLWGQVFGDSPV